MFNTMGAMKPTYSKMQQPHDHKRKNGPIPPIPEPKKMETPQVQVEVQGITNAMPAVHDIRSASNNDIVENVFAGLPSQGPVKPLVEDRYLYVIIGCALMYLWSTHAPDRFHFIST